METPDQLHLLPDGGNHQELRQLVETLRLDAQREVEHVIELHALRLQQWAESALPQATLAHPLPSHPRAGSWVRPDVERVTLGETRPKTPSDSPPVLANARSGDRSAGGRHRTWVAGELPATIPESTVARASTSALRKAGGPREQSRRHLSFSSLPGCVEIGDDGVENIGDGMSLTGAELQQSGGTRPLALVRRASGESSDPPSDVGDSRAGRQSACSGKKSVRGPRPTPSRESSSNNLPPTPTDFDEKLAQVSRWTANVRKTKRFSRSGTSFGGWIARASLSFSEHDVTSQRTESFVRSRLFDQTVGVALMLNALAIGVQVDYLAKHGTIDVPLAFRVLDWMFCSLFVLELALRIVTQKHSFCVGRDRRWNIFDATVVFIQVTDEITQIILRGKGQNAAQDLIDSVGFVRILRLGRLVRFLRLVRLIPGLKSIVYLLMASMGSFFWSLIMLMFIMFCMAVYFTELYGHLATIHGAEATGDARQYWGSVPSSILTLFMAIFGGFDWEIGVDVLKIDSNSHGINTIIFCSYVAFATLVMLNLVTGVFVDGAQRIVKEDRDRELLTVAAHIFATADEDTEEITSDEFARILQSDLMRNYCEVNNINADEVSTLYQLLDEDASDSVCVSELVKGCKMLQGEARAADMQTVKLMCKQHFEQAKEQMDAMEQKIADFPRLLQQEERMVRVSERRVTWPVADVQDFDPDVLPRSAEEV